MLFQRYRSDANSSQEPAAFVFVLGDRGGRFLQNAGTYLSDYTVSDSGRL